VEYKLRIEHKFTVSNEWENSIYSFNSRKHKQLIMFGINPAFTESDITDITNLKLINLVKKDTNFKDYKGYILYNFSNVQDKESKNILSSDCTIAHKKYVKKELVRLNQEKKELCIFYGPNFMKSHIVVVREFEDIFKSFQTDERLFFVKDDNGFTHPRAFEGSMKIEKVTNIDTVIPPKTKKK
jgi:hypothetical protein